jgi:hypothetical protein
MKGTASGRLASAGNPKWTLYCHTHIESGRRYIGLTRLGWRRRWKAHVSLALSRQGGWGHFQNAIRKYGPEAFSHEVLEVCRNLEVANLAEECWIEFYETRNPGKGFNLTKGGLHVPHPIKNPWDRPEYRAAATQRAKDRWKNPQYVLKNRAANKAALNTPESRAKRSEISKQILSDPHVRIHMSAANKGRTFTPEHRANLSAANRERAKDPGFAEKLKAHLDAVRPPPPSSLGRIHSPGTKAKISAANKGRAASHLAIENSVKSRRAKAASKTHFLCKTHGPILLKESFQRKDRVGRIRYECKECKREQNRARRKWG